VKLNRSRGTRSPYAELDFFRGWADEDLHRLERLAEVVEYEPGEVIAAQGLYPREFLVVVCGRADVLVGRRRLGTVETGETIGEQALLAGSATPAAVVAQTYLKALLLGQREFNGLLYEAPSLGRRLSILLADRLSQLPASA
jgi:CRP-like cAMP-binding protein